MKLIRTSIALLALLLAFLPAHSLAQEAQAAGTPSAVSQSDAGPATAVDAPKHAEPAKEAPVMSTYIYFLRAPRLTFSEDHTPEEAAAVSAHFQYLVGLFRQGQVLLAGRAGDLAFPGIVVFKAASAEEAKALMENDPAVKAGVFRAEAAKYQFALSRLWDSTDPPPMSRLPESVSDLAISKSTLVKAPRADIWEAWTTSEGMSSWLVQDANIDLEIGGPYELFFDMTAPEGDRGSEGCRILSFLPEEMLSFEWNTPPSFGELRGQRTHVVVRFEAVDEASTLVKLDHLGFGEGEEWAKVHAYFEQAWSGVMAHLAAHHEAAD